MKERTIKAWAMNCYYEGWCVFASQRAAKSYQEKWTHEPRIVRVSMTITPIAKKRVKRKAKA